MKRIASLITLPFFFAVAAAALPGPAPLQDKMRATQQPSLVPVWNQPNDPATHPAALSRPFRPTTWEDLGGKNIVLTSALRGFETQPDGKGGRRAVNIGRTLDLYTRVYDFGQAISPWYSLAWTANYKELIDEIARRRLVVHHSAGYLPNAGEVPRECDEYMTAKLGSRFTGWDNGEHDCRYTLGAVDEYPKPRSLQDAFEHFMHYEWLIAEQLQHHFSTLSNNTFQHYLADIGDTRMIGCQIAQSKPSVPMWCAMLRGAGKQYGLLWWTTPSEWNRWGAKGYDQWGTLSPINGTSLSMLRRLWYLSYMYGSAVIMSESAIFNGKDKTKVTLDGREIEVPVLSPVGKQHLRIAEWFKKHPHRGVMHTPVAIMWDFYAGWTPARRVPADERPYHAWGNMPWQKGHHQIDMLFRALYPGCEDSAYYRDERGYLPPTPCGDIFDVLFSNTPRFVLNRYNAAVVIGPTKIEGQLHRTLKDFIDRGGCVATTASQLTPQSGELFGVRLTGKTATEQYSQLAGGPAFNESFFTRHMMEPLSGAEILASNYQGDPLVFRRKTQAGGEVLVFAADFGLSDAVTQTQTSTAEHIPLVPPYLLPRHVEAILLPWLMQWNLVEVDGPPVQYLVNLTDAADRFIVTLCNNSATPWRGTLRLRGARIAKGRNWMTDEGISAAGELRVELGATEVLIVELESDRPLVQFKSGYVPEPTQEELERKSETLFALWADEAGKSALAERYRNAGQKAKKQSDR